MFLCFFGGELKESLYELRERTWIAKEGTNGLSVFVESVSWVGKNIVITLGFRVHIVRVGKHQRVESRVCSCVKLES